jgi:nucleotide-binding universal stress UspA family protein
MEKPSRILHPTDFSPASAGAFARALDEARTSDAELLVVHVLAPVVPMVGDGYISPKAYEDLDRAARQHAQKQLDRLVARARKAGIRATPVLLEGSAAEQIVRAARSKRADVIVMGTHGRTGLARLFMGSVAERVIGTAPCPVLTVHGRRSGRGRRG